MDCLFQLTDSWAGLKVCNFVGNGFNTQADGVAAKDNVGVEDITGAKVKHSD